MDIVWGDDVRVQKKVDGIFYNVACGTSCEFNFKNNIIYRTGPNSGLFRHPRVRISECSGNIQGLTKITNQDGLSPMHFLEEGVRRAEGEYRFLFTNQNASTHIILMTAIIESVSVNGNSEAFSEFDISILGVGAFTQDTTDSPTISDSFNVLSDYWTTVNGQNYISGSSALQGYILGVQDTILEVAVEGTQYDPTNGTPGNREFKFTSVNGRVTVRDNFDGTQRVFVEFLRDI